MDRDNPTGRPETLMEQNGVDRIPETQRTSKPSNIFMVLAAAPLCFSVMIIGTLPVVFGLGWWSSVSSLTVGIFIGCLLIAPVGLLGHRTGTNGPVSSGAQFGVKGRVIGALLTVIVAMGFYVLTVITGAQSLIFSGKKLFGMPDTTGFLIGAALVLSLGVSLAALYGQAIVVKLERLGFWILAAVIILAVIVFWPQFDPSYAGGEYVLGGFWTTWLLSMTVGASLPLSTAPFINDYTRYIPSTTPTRSILLGTGLGTFAGMWLAMIAGAFLMTTLQSTDTSFMQGVIDASPTWFLLGLILLGLFGSLTQSIFALYGAGLGLQSLGWKLNRVITTAITSIVGLILVLLALLVYDLTALINAFVTLMIVGISPWVTIILVDLYLSKGKYSASDLFAKNGGRYWYSNGFNIPAVTAWIIAVAIGVMFTNAGLLRGPFADLAGGVDLSFLSSALVGSVLYYVLSFRRGRPVGTAPKQEAAVPAAAE
jgi:purine-cytosine permease-like protein